MNNEDKEILSQLMDGEWQGLDPANSVKTACADDPLKATWSRYHLIRDVIRNDSITVDTSLSASISHAIEEEPTYTNVSAIDGRNGGNAAAVSSTAVDSDSDALVSDTQSPQKPSFWRTGLTGLALAASVALATVVGLNFWQGAPNAGSGVQSVATTAVPGQVLPQVEYVSNNGTYWVTPEAKRSADAEKRLNMLLSTHIESSPTAERTGMLPYSRLVGYDTVAPEQ